MVYLIGFKYDDFSSEGFCVITVASTPERAREIKNYYKAREPEKDYEIQEWEVDVLEPAAEIVNCQAQLGGEYFKNHMVLPYKIIE